MKKMGVFESQRNVKNNQYVSESIHPYKTAIFYHLCNIRHTRLNSVLEIFTTFCDIIQLSLKVKHEKFVINLMTKYGSYNPKIKEFLAMFSLKPAQWTPEYLLRTMI